MIVTIIAESPDGCRKLDVMVRPEQRIGAVFRRLCDNGSFAPLYEEDLSVYSLRRKGYVDPLRTFWQERVYTGDILIFGEEEFLCERIEEQMAGK